MCLPTDAKTISDLFEDIRQLEARRVVLSQPIPCRLCQPNKPCWYHKPFTPDRNNDANPNQDSQANDP